MAEGKKPFQIQLTKKQKKIATIGAAAAAAVALIITGVFLFLNWRPLGQQLEVSSLSSQSSQQSQTPTTINILVCGIDSDVNRNQALTDVILLLSIDVEKKNVQILQIPRDTYVGSEISTGGTGKINSVYSHAKNATGPQALVDVVYDMLHVRIDHYVTITMDGFRRAVDSIGGVRMNVPYFIEFEPGKVLKAGEQTLTGEKAEWFVRYRAGYSEGDLGRVGAQRLFLAALAKQITGMSTSQALGTVSKVYGDLGTDMTVGEILSVGSEVLKINLSSMEINILPGQSTMFNGYSVYSPHAQQAAELLNEKFRPYTDAVAAENLHLEEIINTKDTYDNTGNNLEDILSGETKSSSPSSKGNSSAAAS